MAKPIKILVRYGVTKNMGNYESLRLEEGVELQLDEGESVVGAMDKTRDFLKQKVEEDIKVLTNKG